MDAAVVATLAICLALAGVLGWGIAASRRQALVRITLDGATILVEPLGVMKLLALTSRLAVPVDHVTAAYAVSRPQDDYRPGLRMPGTWMPGLLAGTFVGPEGRSFWVVGQAGSSVRLDLDDKSYAYLVVDVADPAATLRDIHRARRS
jgi:hypothetical protein